MRQMHTALSPRTRATVLIIHATHVIRAILICEICTIRTICDL